MLARVLGLDKKSPKLEGQPGLIAGLRQGENPPEFSLFYNRVTSLLCYWIDLRHGSIYFTADGFTGCEAVKVVGDYFSGIRSIYL